MSMQLQPQLETPWYEKVQTAYDDNGQPNYLDEHGELIEGIYTGLENDIYHALDAYSSTMIKQLVKSTPAHVYRDYYSGISRKRTNAQKNTLDTGTMGHELVLEPVGYYDRYFRLPLASDFPNALHTASDLKVKCHELGLAVSGAKGELAKRVHDKNPSLEIFDIILEESLFNGVGKTAFEAAKQAVTDKQATNLVDALSIAEIEKLCNKRPIDGLVWDDAEMIKTSFLTQQRAVRCITDGFAELTVISRCPDTGLMLKAKFDYINRSSVASDVKTTKSANPAKFAMQCRDLRYDVQEAFYRYVAELQGIDIQVFVFIAIEYVEASICEVFELASVIRNKAYLDLKDGLFLLNHCLTNNEWPGYSKSNQVFTIKW